MPPTFKILERKLDLIALKDVLDEAVEKKRWIALRTGVYNTQIFSPKEIKEMAELSQLLDLVEDVQLVDPMGWVEKFQSNIDVAIESLEKLVERIKVGYDV